MLTYIILRSESMFYMHRMFAVRREYRADKKRIRGGGGGGGGGRGSNQGMLQHHKAREQVRERHTLAR